MFDFESTWQGLQASTQSLAWLEPIKGLLAAFVFGQIISWAYQSTYRGLSYSRGFGQTLVLTTIAAAILVLSMSHSLIAGIGLFGVLSMIRFRVTLKAPRDLVFVMGAATIGTACGVHAILAATTGTLVFALVALYLHHGAFGARVHFDGVLRFRLNANNDATDQLKSILNDFCKRYELLSVAEVAQGTRVEHAYQVQFWKRAEREDLLAQLRSQLDASDARLLLQEATLEY